MSKPVYLLVGEPFLADEALDEIRAETAADPLSEVTLDAGATSSEILAAVRTPSLLGGRRLVVLREAHDLKKEQIDALTAYLASPSPSSVLVLLASSRTRLASAVQDAGALVSLEAPKGRRLVGWLRERARRQGLRLDDRAGWALVDAVGADLRELDGALEQLSAALPSEAVVGVAEVRRMFPRLADERIFAFTDAVGERRLTQAMTALRRLLEQEDQPLILIGALASHIRRLLVARGFGDALAVGEALGIAEWRARRVQEQARSYREEELVQALQVLAATDLEIKGGDWPPDAALERAVIEIVGSGRQ